MWRKSCKCCVQKQNQGYGQSRLSFAYRGDPKSQSLLAYHRTSLTCCCVGHWRWIECELSNLLEKTDWLSHSGFRSHLWTISGCDTCLKVPPSEILFGYSHFFLLPPSLTEKSHSGGSTFPPDQPSSLFSNQITVNPTDNPRKSPVGNVPCNGQRSWSS